MTILKVSTNPTLNGQDRSLHNIIKHTKEQQLRLLFFFAVQNFAEFHRNHVGEGFRHTWELKDFGYHVGNDPNASNLRENRLIFKNCGEKPKNKEKHQTKNLVPNQKKATDPKRIFKDTSLNVFLFFFFYKKRKCHFFGYFFWASKKTYRPCGSRNVINRINKTKHKPKSTQPKKMSSKDSDSSPTVTKISPNIEHS